MKVVRHKITGNYVYRSVPDFESGKGIANAVFLGHSASDLEEIEITQTEWDAYQITQEASKPRNIIKERLKMAANDKERLTILVEYLELK